jgi:hypothetical protein
MGGFPPTSSPVEHQNQMIILVQEARRCGLKPFQWKHVPLNPGSELSTITNTNQVSSIFILTTENIFKTHSDQL